MGGRVKGGDLRAQAQVHVVVGVPPFGVDEAAVALRLAQQIGLGQRRPLIRAVALITDQRDAPVAVRAQRLCRRGAGQAGADDHEARCSRHRKAAFRVGDAAAPAATAMTASTAL